MGDLVRVRGDLMADLKRAKQRLLAMLLRHGRIWRTSKYWTAEHRRWLGRQGFEDPALQVAFGHYRVALAAREAEMAAIEAELLPWAHRDPLGETVAKLTAYRGVGELTALTRPRGRGLATVSPCPLVYVLYRVGAHGVLQRTAHPARPHHQGWPAGRPHRAGGGRLALPAHPQGRGRPGPPAQRPERRHHRPVPDRAGAAGTPSSARCWVTARYPASQDHRGRP